MDNDDCHSCIHVAHYTKNRAPLTGDIHLWYTTRIDREKAMPNKRDKNKSGISVYVPSQIKTALMTEASRRKQPMSQLITEIYHDKLTELGYDVTPVQDEEK